MTTQNSAMVLEQRGDREIRVDYYIRAVRGNAGLFDDGATETDRWAAYREEPVVVTVGIAQEQYTRVERISTSTRSTLDQARGDMWAAINLHIDPDRKHNPAHIIRRGHCPWTLSDGTVL
jgi:hypothetical protein